MVEEEKEITEVARRLFMTRGIRSVSMDEIAREQGISKKTLYQFFKDKESLIEQVVKLWHHEERCAIDRIKEDTTDPIELFVSISNTFREMVKEFNPIIIYELKKYYPKIWKIHDENMGASMLLLMEDILKDGQSKGYIRKNLDPKIIARGRSIQIENGFDQEIFPSREFDNKVVQEQFLLYFMYGVCTAKGIKKFEENITTQHKTPIHEN